MTPTRTALLLLTIVAGCAGTSAPGPEAPAAGERVAADHAAEHAAEAEHAEALMPAELDAFHDVLAPVWHADLGPARDARACEVAGELSDRAEAVATGGVPELGREGEIAWQQEAERLVAAVERLSATCEIDTGGAADAMTEIHDRFHALLDLASPPRA